jgi:DNA replication protein DnaC
MSTTDQLIPFLKKLKLSGTLQSLELRIREAVDDNLSHMEFLYRLFGDEVERREAKQLDMRLRRAAFDGSKTIESFDFAFNAKVPKAKVIELATGNFIQKHQNVVLVGPTGVGKSHVAQGLGHRACRLGNDVVYQPAHKLLGQLRAARADGSYDRRLSRLAGVDLLIIDDLGLHPLRGEEPTDLYEIFRMRYETGSMVITSNRDVQEWYPLFGDDLLASAAMDRLLHHAEVVVMEGHSYRNPPKKRAARKAA